MKNKKQIIRKLTELEKEKKHLLQHLNRLNNATSKRFFRRFVIIVNKKGSHTFKITNEGKKELAKYGKKEERVADDIFWNNPGVACTPKKCFCMICGDTNIVKRITYDGGTPNFAVCPKHIDFLSLGRNIIVDTKKSK
jgi:hypothetical protein